MKQQFIAKKAIERPWPDGKERATTQYIQPGDIVITSSAKERDELMALGALGAEVDADGNVVVSAESKPRPKSSLDDAIADSERGPSTPKPAAESASGKKVG